MGILRASPDLAWDGLRYLRQLRRAGVPVLWGATHPGLRGRGALRRAAAGDPGRRTAPRRRGLRAEHGLPAGDRAGPALGAEHRFVDAGLGRLETVAAEDGRTSLETVFATGDGAAIGGARIALARGRLAGLAAAADLGFAAADAAPARAELRRALAFQDGLWRLFAAPPFDVGAIADDTIVCRCEEVTAGTLRREQARGVRSLGEPEEGDPRRHGPLPGADVRRDRRPALRRGGGGGLRRARAPR